MLQDSDIDRRSWRRRPQAAMTRLKQVKSRRPKKRAALTFGVRSQCRSPRRRRARRVQPPKANARAPQVSRHDKQMLRAPARQRRARRVKRRSLFASTLRYPNSGASALATSNVLAKLFQQAAIAVKSQYALRHGVSRAPTTKGLASRQAGRQPATDSCADAPGTLAADESKCAPGCIEMYSLRHAA